MNLNQLSDACAKLGYSIDSEAIRRWERGLRQCAHPEAVAEVLARIPLPNGRGYLRASWILHGGPLPPEHVERAPGPAQEPLANWRAVARVA